MKKRLAIFLALLVAAALPLSSCGNGSTAETEGGTDTNPSANTDGNTVAEAETEVDPATLDELPTDNKDYEDYTFTILGHFYEAGSVAWGVQDIAVDELTGERINDAVFERNNRIADRFGVTIAKNLETYPSDVAKKLIQSGDDAFDLLQTTVQNQASVAVDGYLANMNDLPYVNFEKAWWDSSTMEGIRVGDKTFYALGDSALNGKKASWLMLFNKTLTDKAGIPNLYDTVREGKWTLDLLQTYAESIAVDVNGDGEMKWGEDVFGVGLQDESVSPLLIGTGAKLIELNPDGTYNYRLNSEQVVSAMERINGFMKKSNSNFVLNCNRYDGMANQWIEFRKIFMADQMGFYILALSGVNLIAGDMQSDFGIIPVPKLNEAQDRYYSTFQYGNAHSLSVPKSAQDLTRTGLITEALQMFSHDTILPAYYDYTLTNRNARDTDSAEMLDLIFASRNFDISLAYNNKTGVLSFLQTNAVADSFDYASKEAANRQKVEKAMDEIIEKVLHGGE